MTCVLGIDPGKSGGLAWNDPKTGWDGVTKMPATEADIARLIRDSVGHCYAFIEKVHSMPKQGVKSTFTFGQNYGFLRGVLIALGIPFEEVSPRVWQKAMGCLSGGDKNVTKAKAQQLFPQLKITHATADALLIAEYGRRVLAERGR